MHDFQFYVRDDRYSVATLNIPQSEHLDTAYVLARNVLASKRYRAVEVWAGDKRLFSLDGSDHTARD